MSFYEPALDAALADQDATVVHFHDGGRSEFKKIVVLHQVYSSTSNQEAIADLCLSLIREAGVRLIAVEGGEGAIKSEPRFNDVRSAMGTSELSVGVLAAATRSEYPVDLVGVDDMAVVRQSQDCRTRVERGAVARDRIFAEIRKVLLTCQDEFYPPQLRMLRRKGLAVYYQDELSFPESVNLLYDLAARRKKSLVDFPHIRRFRRLMSHENATMDRAIRREQKKFVKRISRVALGWFKEFGNREVSIDWKKAAVPIAFWAMNMGYKQEDLERTVMASAPESFIDNCIQWYGWWVLDRVAEVDRLQHYKLYEDWMRFALYAQIPYFDLKALREYVAYLRDADDLAPMRLFEEFTEATQMLADGLGSEATMLFQTEERLNELYSGLRLSKLPNRVDPDGLSLDIMQETLNRLGSVTNLPRGMLEPSYLADLKEPLRSASGYVHYNSKRSRLLAERTIEAMANYRQLRAILVSGGFHSRGIQWTFEEVKDLTWSFILPKTDFQRDGITGRHII
jgi:hypothetical protein